MTIKLLSRSTPDRRREILNAGMPRAVELLAAVCTLAGSISFLDEINAEIQSYKLDVAIRDRKTEPIFDWLLDKFSFQGISDRVARDYADKHGRATWSQLYLELSSPGGCPKLRSYWQFSDCRYDKTSRSCWEPEHFDTCSLPQLRLRNGRLNQTAYSFFLFVRDIADSDLVGWINGRLQGAVAEPGITLHAARQEALLGPLRNVYGVSDKVLTMALSTLLMSQRTERPVWFETGKSMITIDTLAHNFLHRTGILQDLGKSHAFGTACYACGGCASIIQAVAGQIDCRSFNPSFPAEFPRFVQHAIWRFCAAEAVNQCNGNRIDDRSACADPYCRIGPKCDRKPLKSLDFSSN